MEVSWFLNPGWLIAFPLFGALLLLFFGRRIGQRAGVFASGLLGLSFLVGLILFATQLSHEGQQRTAYVHMFDWITVGSFRVGADLTLDQLSIVMVLVVTGVGTLIHIYSIGYMEGDPRYPRFFCYLNLFAAFMLTLVLAGNLLLLYVGWEGVGLCSFLLIGFWFERAKASNAAKKAFLVNRVGDFAFLIGIFVLAKAASTLSIPLINAAATKGLLSQTQKLFGPGPYLPAGIATVAALLLFAGATGKSAQIPLYVWLPDAMEGPTPVSALIHAATMVTAGVYMVARMSPLFQAGSALTVVAWIGALTALWAALMASFEFDIKRVLAYSTISQLGYMFLANGVQGYSAAMFHLVTHAFFKALMFLGAGAVMHSLAGETDMRKMGGLRKAMPITGYTFLVGWLAISGIFPLAGFWSKDAILASAWHQGQYALWAIGVGTALLTAFYMSRLYFRVFEGPLLVPDEVEAHNGRVHDAPVTMAVALVPLALLSVVGGALNLPGSLILEHFLEPVVGRSEVPGGLTPWLLASTALVAGLAGIALAYLLYVRSDGRARRASLYGRLKVPIVAAANKFYVDELYGRAIVLPGKALANFSAYTLDARGIDGVVRGTGELIAGISERTRRVQSGYVRNYAATFLIGVVILISIVVVRLGAA
ncbi:MAG TPA: NADH-quinone oxidoreductase subunit L [Actinomycetota bacterium]|jgi:NADH-quinone oxidoreductase subunit L|nr:NADH-quinone oxidoreductase subunit L [Actinomycetota bacterium]